MYKLETILRNRWFWLVFLASMYMSGFFIIGPYVYVFPFVVPQIPLGLYRVLFPDYINYNVSPPYYNLFRLGYFLIFGGLLLFYLMRIKKVNKGVLYSLGLIIILIVMLTFIGCARIPELRQP